MACADFTPMAGIIVKVGATLLESPPTRTFGCLRKIAFPKYKREKTEITCLDDTTLIKTFCQGYGEPEPLQVTVRFNASDYAFIFSMFANAESRNWLIQFPLVGAQVSPSKWAFASWIEDFGGSEQVAGSSEKVDVTFSVFPQGTTFTAGS